MNVSVQNHCQLNLAMNSPYCLWSSLLDIGNIMFPTVRRDSRECQVPWRYLLNFALAFDLFFAADHFPKLAKLLDNAISVVSFRAWTSFGELVFYRDP